MNIKKFQILTPITEWNKSEQHRKLPDKCRVLDWRKGFCQTGIMVLVNYEGGGQVWLDAAWFEEYRHVGRYNDSWQFV